MIPFIEMNNFPENVPVSIAVDVIARKPEDSPFLGMGENHSFVFSRQRFDRIYLCFPLHVMISPSSQAMPEVWKVMGELCPTGSDCCADSSRTVLKSHFTGRFCPFPEFSN
jgi:hypothetical protein